MAWGLLGILRRFSTGKPLLHEPVSSDYYSATLREAQDPQSSAAKAHRLLGLEQRVVLLRNLVIGVLLLTLVGFLFPGTAWLTAALPKVLSLELLTFVGLLLAQGWIRGLAESIDRRVS